MTINDKVKDEKIQYYINREAAKISASSSGKIDKYEYILQLKKYCHLVKSNFTYSSLGKALEKQTGTMEDQNEKQVKVIESRVEK